MRVKEMTESYIVYRWSLGEKYITGATMLRSFARHAGEDKDAGEIDRNTCVSFLYGKECKVTQSWFLRYSALKWLFGWAMVRGYMTEIPLPEEKPRRIDHMTPYIYSKVELRKLFDAALTYQKNRSRIPPECIQMILKVTYFLGLRIHETVSLTVDDIDFEEGHAVIRESKFNKTRIVPFNGQVREMLKGFAGWRASIHPNSKEGTAFFLDRAGKPIRLDTVRGCFQRIRAAAGIVRNDGAYYQPRLHDLRHTFAVNRLTAWYREGKNVQKLISSLSTYLGHDKVSNTSVYLTMTDNLLKEASKRFEAYSNGETT